MNIFESKPPATIDASAILRKLVKETGFKPTAAQIKRLAELKGPFKKCRDRLAASGHDMVKQRFLDQQKLFTAYAENEAAPPVAPLTRQMVADQARFERAALKVELRRLSAEVGKIAAEISDEFARICTKKIEGIESEHDKHIARYPVPPVPCYVADCLRFALAQATSSVVRDAGIGYTGDAGDQLPWLDL